MDFYSYLKEYYIYVFAFIVALAIANLTTPLSKRLALKLGAVDYPKARGVHEKAVPLAGGLSIFAGFTSTILIFWRWVPYDQYQSIIGLLIGATIITTLGLLDDVYSLSPKIRIVIQFLAATVVIISGTVMTGISIPFIPNSQIEFGIFSNVITAVWIIGVTNAVNLIDGLDGLATGLSSIASVTLLIIALLFGDPLIAGFAILLTATLAGSCLGFLPHNFNPAKIFMGDTGSTFLGFTLSVISIQTMLKTYTALTLIVAALVLALPIFDTFFAIVRRVANRRPIDEGDRGHLHHRLIDRGLSHRRAVLTLYAIAGFFGMLAILIVLQDFWLALGAILIMIVVFLIDKKMQGKKGKKKILERYNRLADIKEDEEESKTDDLS